MANPLRGEVIRLYKNLLYLGREYPQGAAYFRQRLKSAFMKNKDVTEPEEIKKLVARGEFVIKELEALYFLRKYRAMKKRYYEPENFPQQPLYQPQHADGSPVVGPRCLRH